MKELNKEDKNVNENQFEKKKNFDRISLEGEKRDAFKRECDRLKRRFNGNGLVKYHRGEPSAPAEYSQYKEDVKPLLEQRKNILKDLKPLREKLARAQLGLEPTEGPISWTDQIARYLADPRVLDEDLLETLQNNIKCKEEELEQNLEKLDYRTRTFLANMQALRNSIGAENSDDFESLRSDAQNNLELYKQLSVKQRAAMQNQYKELKLYLDTIELANLSIRDHCSKLKEYVTEYLLNWDLDSERNIDCHIVLDPMD